MLPQSNLPLAAITGDPSASTLAWLLIYLAVALVFSFLCSVAEAVLLSVNGGYIDSVRATHPAAAKRLKRFRAEPEEPLSAILTLNTIAHTVGAAGVGHQAAVLLGENWLGATSAVMTLLILIGSEIIPKTLGATHWRSLAPTTALGVHLLIVTLKPVIVVLRIITDRVTKRTSVDRSRSEVESTLLLASESKTLAPEESLIIRNLVRLRKVSLKDIMTPRVVVFSVPADLTAGEFRKEHSAARFTRIPLHEGNIDSTVGYVLLADVLNATDPTIPLSTWKRELPIVPETLPVSTAYEALASSTAHIALVVNEFGDTAGIITNEDVIETLLGREIVDESDVHTDLRKAARDKVK